MLLARMSGRHFSTFLPRLCSCYQNNHRIEFYHVATIFLASNQKVSKTHKISLQSPVDALPARKQPSVLFVGVTFRRQGTHVGKILKGTHTSDYYQALLLNHVPA